ALYEADGDRIDKNREDDRNRARRALRSPDSDGAGGHDHIDLQGDELSGKHGEPFGMTLRPPIFDHHGLALYPSQIAQTSPKRHGIGVVGPWAAGAEISDPRDSALLGVDYDRRQRECDAEHDRDQPPHCASLPRTRSDRSEELRESTPWRGPCRTGAR